MEAFTKWVGKMPLLFMCLQGSNKDGQVTVTTVKHQSWWQEATGDNALAMAAKARIMCGDSVVLQYVAPSRTYTATTAADYIKPMATLTACQLVDPRPLAPVALLGYATEHFYELNHVYVVLPTKDASVKTKDDRLFARLDVWAHSKNITLAFRGKAMLRLASLEDGQDK